MVCTRHQDIGLITSPIGVSNRKQLSNLLNIISAISKNICFITGNAGSNIFENNTRIHTFSIKYTIKSNLFLKVISYIVMQIKLSCKFIYLSGKAKTWIFFHGSGTLLLPVFTAKLLRKRIILMLPGSSKALKYANDPFYKVVKILELINLSLANEIIVYSNLLIKEWCLERYRRKIKIAHEHFIDFSVFCDMCNYQERQNLVGYVGRLSEEKGILNLIKAIPEIIKRNSNIKFLIIGDGKLRSKIESYLIENNIINYVIFCGWVPHDDLPMYLNKMKLMILPSYSEGLPNVVIEAMACGTPVIATPVGAIPDVIEHYKTGFIIRNNSPSYIAECVINALEYPYIEQIINNANNYVKREFSYRNSVLIFEKIIGNVYIN